ncbi:hypothetical protein, partial [Streptomyces prunicolor]|uniref:hypothetical protein n=1 Tax=Streptomyces prunicolor TaxID=67348 RepID=UPI0033DB11BF
VASSSHRSARRSASSTLIELEHSMFKRIARIAARTAAALAEAGRETVTEAVRQGVAVVQTVRAEVEAGRPAAEVIVAGPDVENPPTAAEVAQAAEAHEVARELYNDGSRGKRSARKILDRAATGEYAGWAVKWVQSSRREIDREAVAAICAGLGIEVPTRPAAPTLKLSRIEQAEAEVIELIAA